MGKLIEYRFASQEDIPGIVKFINLYYNRNFTAEYFQWQYFDSVFPTVLSCAFYNNEIVGMFGLQKKTLNTGLKIGQAIDMLVDSNYRGNGIFQEVGDRAIHHFNDLSMLCVLPNLNGKIAIEKKMNWSTLGRVDCLQLTEKSLTADGNVPLKNDKYSNSQEFKFQYNESIIDWRFTNNPFHSYSKINVNSSTCSFVKLFFNKKEGKTYGDIVYFTFDNPQSFNALIRKSIKYLKEKNANVINIWGSDRLAYLLMNIGFNKVLQERYFCLGQLNNNDHKIKNLNNWHLMMSDVEML